jgi:hypothetical protein
MVVGLLNLAAAIFTVSSLHFATEKAARCASVQTTVCTSAGAVQAQALSAYNGPNIGPTFTYAKAACGNQVTGSVTYVLNTGIAPINIPLSVSSCFP